MNGDCDQNEIVTYRVVTTIVWHTESGNTTPENSNLWQLNAHIGLRGFNGHKLELWKHNHSNWKSVFMMTSNWMWSYLRLFCFQFFCCCFIVRTFIFLFKSNPYHCYEFSDFLNILRRLILKTFNERRNEKYEKWILWHWKVQCMS